MCAHHESLRERCGRLFVHVLRVLDQLWVSQDLLLHLQVFCVCREDGAPWDIVKAKSSAEDSRATVGLVSNLPHPRVNETKQHTNEWDYCDGHKMSQFSMNLWLRSGFFLVFSAKQIWSHFGHKCHKSSQIQMWLIQTCFCFCFDWNGSEWTKYFKTYRKWALFLFPVQNPDRNSSEQIHRETVWKGWRPRVGYLYQSPNFKFGRFWVVFEWWSQILPSTKLFRHGFEQSCSAMATQKLEVKVQQHDEDAESGKNGCRSPSRAHGKACEQVRDSYARRILYAAAIWGGDFAHREPKAPPNIWGTNLKLLT